ncbi:hypothetical protein SEPCBS119000_000586 [Sporothrix epigloea]|uniref:Myb-like domain-containing protein n=1 Tax=Sporothrix epigloea TaxID=1892477 RepID=A0ABP0D5Z9_9PEZI
MTSPVLSSPSQQLLSFNRATSRRQSTPITDGDSRARDEQHALPVILQQRLIRVGASLSSESDEGQDIDPTDTVDQDDIGGWTYDIDTVGGRREFASDSSNYVPSSSSSSSGSDVPERNEEIRSSMTKISYGDHEGEADDQSSSSSEEDGEIAAGYRAGLKRPHQHTISDTSTDAESSPQPDRRKRLRSSINMSFVELLADDMEDARRQYTPHSWRELETTQVGLSVWTAEEKEMLYEAVSRLGRDDIPRITARLLGSKSEIEVRHYLDLLQRDAERRRNELRAPLYKPLLSSFPAAAEISEACCDALEESADWIAQREDDEEDRNEGRKWGQHWLLTGDNCSTLSRAALKIAGMPTEDDASNHLPVTEDGQQPDRTAEIGAQLRPLAVPPLALFHVRNMILLSERVFMNGVDEDAHYLGLGNALPAAHMSALHDLYELVYSLTQRVVATAIYSCQARRRPGTRTAPAKTMTVRKRDVYAAVASLGLQKNSHEFWARCPRRLGLKVARSAIPFAGMESTSRPEISGETAERQESCRRIDSDSSDQLDTNDEGGDDIISYDEAEQALSLRSAQTVAGQRPKPVPEAVDWHYESAYIDDGDSDSDAVSDTVSDNGSERSDVTADLSEQRIRDEANEVICYSATGYPQAAWARNSLENRIRLELREEEYASAVDDRASRQDELYLWAVIGQEPPPDLTVAASFDDMTAAPYVEGFSTAARRYPVEEVIETGRNWREKLHYEAEWEAAAAQT